MGIFDEERTDFRPMLLCAVPLHLKTPLVSDTRSPVVWVCLPRDPSTLPSVLLRIPNFDDEMQPGTSFQKQTATCATQRTNPRTHTHTRARAHTRTHTTRQHRGLTQGV